MEALPLQSANNDADSEDVSDERASLLHPAAARAPGKVGQTRTSSANSNSLIPPVLRCNTKVGFGVHFTSLSVELLRRFWV